MSDEFDHEEYAEKLERAFVQFVNDQHDWERRQGGADHVSPVALGCCVNCGFPLYETDGLYHYSYDRDNKVRACKRPMLRKSRQG